MKYAYMYTRVSTSMQADNYSIEAQKNLILGHAKLHDIKIIGDYSDAGFSGKNATGRPAFMQMMEDIQNHKDKVDYVIVFKLSRFGRNAADTMNYLQLMEDYNVGLICAEDGTNLSGGVGKMIVAVLASMAELERENIRAQTMAGRRQKAKDGGWNGGFAPYGYELIDGKLSVKEEEADAVREIFKLYTETNYGFNGVAKLINERFRKNPRHNGYLTKFSATQVRSIIVNPVYKGVISFGRRVTEKIKDTRNEYHVVVQKDRSNIIYAKGQHDPIVSEDVWNIANAKAEASSGRKEKTNKNHEYILSGIVKCPCCGAPMYGVPNGVKYRKDGTRYPMSYSYKCRNQTRETGHECSARAQYSATKIDNAVRDIVFEMVTQENFKDALMELVDKHVNTDEIQNELNDVEKLIRKFEFVKSRINNQLLNLDYTDQVADQLEESLNQRLRDAMIAIEELEAKRDALNDRLLESNNSRAAQQSVYDFLCVFKDLYDELTDAEKKQTMRAFISSIELYPRVGRQKREQWIKAIHFNFPVSYHGEIVEDIELDNEGHIFRPKEITDETVVLLRRKNIDDAIQFTWTDDEFGNIGCNATYGDIRGYVKQVYGLNVSSLNVAQIKAKYGIISHKSYNTKKSNAYRQSSCTLEKERAITEAFKHFKMI